MGDEAALQPWSTIAINLPEHSGNPIHTDAGARAAGYDAAIVAGTTIYAYLTHPPAAAWGEQWLTSGGGELRLRSAVLDEQRVDCVIGAAVVDGVNRPVVEATVDGESRATFELWAESAPPPMREGEDLPTVEFELTPKWCDYGVRSGDDLSLYGELGIAHPAMWPSLANEVFDRHLVDGSWIHTRSRIWHQGAARVGQQLTIRSVVVDRFETRAGERALVDMEMLADGAPVARLEHEALVRLF